MRVLSIDPAVRNTGYAVLEGDPRKPTVLAYDVISIPKKLAQSAALAAVAGVLVAMNYNIAQFSMGFIRA